VGRGRGGKGLRLPRAPLGARFKRRGMRRARVTGRLCRGRAREGARGRREPEN
jgi:hypothetical protein